MKTILLLKTRTEKDKYESLLNENGFATLFISVLTHNFVKLSELKDHLHATDSFSSLIITSQRAVDALRIAVGELNEATRNKLTSKLVYTVGPATARAVEEIGFTTKGKEAGNHAS
jgi:uroporphyrinogen-III synthase